MTDVEPSGPGRRERPPTSSGGGGTSPDEAAQGPGRDVDRPPPLTRGDGDRTGATRVGQVADVGRRVSADLVDFLVLAILGAAVGFLLEWLGWGRILTPGVRGQGGPPLGLPAVPATLVTLAIHLGYWTLMEGRGGQSVGKLAFGIRAVREDASPLDYTAALKRHVLFYLPQLLGWVPSLTVLVLAAAAQITLVLAGLITYVLDAPLRQGFHDKFAGTLVVYA